MPPKKKKTDNAPVNVVIRCASGGYRASVPQPVRPSTTTLASILESVRDQLPPAAFEDDGGGGAAGGGGGEATLVYLRTTVKRSQWGTTTLKGILGDGGGGAGGVALTLRLPAPATKKPPPTGSTAVASAASAAAAGGAASATEEAEPMDLDVDDVPPSSALSAPKEAIDSLLSSNFDADSIEALSTLLKIIDNLLKTSPETDRRVRSIRRGNAAFERKVACKQGGIDVLKSIGFVEHIPIGGQAASGGTLELPAEREVRSILIDARKCIASALVEQLGMDPSEVPPEIPAMRPPPQPAASIARTSGARVGGGGSQFDPYRTHNFNTQAAAVGAPNANAINPDGTVSHTERQLNKLNQRKERLERDAASQLGSDRGLVAVRQGAASKSGGGIASLSTNDADFGSAGGGRGDGSLLASRMKRMEEERKKREEGGFTTKAMRDLEKMKKAKVYSHTQLRIGFADGTALTAKFLPSETVTTVRSVVSSAFKPELQHGLQFDLYVAPPRKILDPTKRLDEEGLVPAAKVHVSWKVGGAPPTPSKKSRAGDYIRDELFGDAAAAAVEFPEAKSLVPGSDGAKMKRGDSNVSSSSSKGDGPSREELMMQRMLGKKPGLLGKVGRGKGPSGDGDGGGKKSSGSGKPKWFKG